MRGLSEAEQHLAGGHIPYTQDRRCTGLAGTLNPARDPSQPRKTNLVIVCHTTVRLWPQYTLKLHVVQFQFLRSNARYSMVIIDHAYDSLIT